MEAKKNPALDVNRHLTLFRLVGLAVALALVWAVFEYRSLDTLATVDLGELQDAFTETLDIPITEMPPPPPPVLQQPDIVEVPDEQEIKQDIETQLEVEITQQVQDAPAPVVAEVKPAAPPVQEESDEVFMVVEEAPQPEGGMAAFRKYIAENIVYPRQARRMGVEGTVVLQAVIDKDGTISEVNVLKGIGAGCDEEAVRVLKSAPRWKPGKQRGRPVKVKLALPIKFGFN